MYKANFAPSDCNTTPDVTACLSATSGDIVMNFEKGEYHFFEKGCHCGFYSPTNNETGYKNVVFPILEKQNITINGNGSTFIFHENAFPFIVRKSTDITIRDLHITTSRSPVAFLTITEKTREGFRCVIDRHESPYSIENGHLVFELENALLSTEKCKLSLHAIGRCLITYLFAGDCEQTQQNLPAAFSDTDAYDEGDTLFFRYRQNENSSPCAYEVGETVSINLEENRRRDVFFLEQSENTVLSDIHIHRGGGMGVIAQLCTDIEIDSLTVKPDEGSAVSLTADILHFVNCNGKVSVHGCDFASSLDDACNIHGNYAEIIRVSNNFVTVAYKHEAHSFLEMYFPNDILSVIDRTTCEVITEFKVLKAEFADKSGLVQKIYFEGDLSDVTPGMLVESAERMPDIHIYGNTNYDIPHWRLSGKGNIVVENNRFNSCLCPVYAFDLAEYWYESGRISSLTVKNNIFCGTKNPNGSVITGVSGFDGDATPKIHGDIIIENNIFDIENNGNPYTVNGFSNVTIINNTITGEYK